MCWSELTQSESGDGNLPQQGLASSSPHSRLTRTSTNPGEIPSIPTAKRRRIRCPAPGKCTGRCRPTRHPELRRPSRPWPARTSRGRLLRHGLPLSGPAEFREGARAHGDTQLWKRRRSPARAGTGGAGLPGAVRGSSKRRTWWKLLAGGQRV